MDTLGSFRAELVNWMRGDFGMDTDVPLLNTAINDAIEDIWGSMMQAQLARFFGVDSPVTFTVAQGLERYQLVSINDPTVVPTLSAVAGGALAARTILGGYTFVTESGSETQLSPTATVTTLINELGQVAAPTNPGNAFGWNFYASPTNVKGLMALQNQNPLPFGLAYTEPVTGWQDYPVDQQGAPVTQAASTTTPTAQGIPSENTTGDNISYITHLEIRTSDTLLRGWNQFDTDSEIFRRYARTLSSASEYQTYVWDLVNGNRLEFRPAMGLSFSPRYFYVQKPRRMRYDQAVLPYQSIQGFREFVRSKAIADLKLAVDEYIANESWTNKAEQIRVRIQLALLQESWSKDLRVAPHLF